MKPSLRQRTRLLAHLRRAYHRAGDKRTRAQYGRLIAIMYRQQPAIQTRRSP
jgi:hypothetical protein